jgi:hypothetical protein
MIRSVRQRPSFRLLCNIGAYQTPSFPVQQLNKVEDLQNQKQFSLYFRQTK